MNDIIAELFGYCSEKEWFPTSPETERRIDALAKDAPELEDDLMAILVDGQRGGFVAGMRAAFMLREVV